MTTLVSARLVSRGSWGWRTIAMLDPDPLAGLWGFPALPQASAVPQSTIFTALRGGLADRPFRAYLLGTETKEMIMKIVASTLVALALIAGTVAPAAAYSGSVIERLDQDQRGGHGGG